MVVSEFGKPATLTCQFTKPVHRAKWYRNGQELWPQMGKILMSVEGKTATLEIKKVDKNDAGQYTCGTSEGEISAPAVLNLSVGPIITIPEKLEGEVVLHAGKELDFHVEYNGYPVPKIHITHNGASIKGRADLDYYDDEVSVRVKHLTRQDSGTIKVNAENEHGKVEKNINISVIDVPSEPRNIQATDTTPNSTVISWSVPEESNGSPITGYIIERKAVDNNRWRPVGNVKANVFSFEADELFANYVYGFRVIAVNDVGEGEPSEAIDVITPPEEEDENSQIFPHTIAKLDRPMTPRAEVEDGKVSLTWNEIPETSEFVVERREKDDEDWLEITKIDKVHFVDRSITTPGEYFFRVTAKGLYARSDPSHETKPCVISHVREMSVASDVERGEEAKKKIVKKMKKTAAAKEASLSFDEDKQNGALVETSVTVATEEAGKGETAEEKKEETKKKKKKQPTPADDILETKEKLRKRVGETKSPGRSREGSVDIQKEGTSSEVASRRSSEQEDKTSKVEVAEKKAEDEKKDETEKKVKKVVKKKPTAKDTKEPSTDVPAEDEKAKPEEKKEKKEKRAVKKAELKAAQETVTAEAGKKAELVVSTSDEEAEITWTKDGCSLDASYKPSKANGQCKLTIPTVNASTAGSFTCTAKNSAGETSVTIALVVKGMNSFLRKQNITLEKCSLTPERAVVEVKVGEPATLTININGSPRPDCEWTKDGAPLTVIHTFLNLISGSD